MTTTPRPTTHDTPAPMTPHAAVEQLTRNSVRTVFKAMLNLEMTDDEPSPLPAEEAGQIVGSVSFIGEFTGIIHLYTGAGFAKTITARMIGLAEAEVDGAMVNDAIAELGNVVVGAVKSRLCDRGWSCTLTIPSVVRGYQLSVESIADASRSIIGFRAGNQRLIVEMLVKKNPQA